jgi:hypothetical protein
MRNTRVPVIGLKPSLAKASTTPPAKIKRKVDKEEGKVQTR